MRNSIYENSHKFKVSELNDSFLSRIKIVCKGQEDAEIIISFGDNQARYFETLNRSIKDLESGNNLVSF